MTETEKDEQPFDGPNPDAGIICPWNKDDQGPAGMRIHCLIWKNWDDFLEWSAEAGYCRPICHFGRNPEATRRSKEIRARYAGEMPAWQRVMPKAEPMFHPAVKDAGPPKDYQKPKRGRKIG